MQLTAPSSRNLFLLSLGVYGLIRLLSFTTTSFPILNAVLAAFLIGVFFVLCIKRIGIAWIVLVSELLLGGSGHFFELFTVALRSWFLIIFLAVWIQKTGREADALSKRIPQISIIIFLVFLAAFNGLLHHHQMSAIIADAISFAFLLLTFPALTLTTGGAKKQLKPVFAAAIVGTALFCLGTLAWYGSAGALQDSYYHWFRDIAGGKITDMGTNFFRIVLPEQLLLVPIVLVLASQLITNMRQKWTWLLLVASTSLLALNLSRGYMLGLIIGLLVLGVGYSWKRWLTVSVSTVLLVVGCFTALHLIVSGWTSPGWELFGLRLGSIATPQTETSSAIRLAILPAATTMIREHPFVGIGLGASVTFLHPLTKQPYTTTQFDWGYIEMIVEFGLLGFALYLSCVLLAGFQLFHTRKTNALAIPFLASLASLVMINITAPALFHVFGILLLVILFSELYKKTSTG